MRKGGRRGLFFFIVALFQTGAFSVSTHCSHFLHNCLPSSKAYSGTLILLFVLVTVGLWHSATANLLLLSRLFGHPAHWVGRRRQPVAVAAIRSTPDRPTSILFFSISHYSIVVQRPLPLQDIPIVVFVLLLLRRRHSFWLTDLAPAECHFCCHQLCRFCLCLTTLQTVL